MQMDKIRVNNKMILGVVISLLLLIIIIFYSSKENYFNKIEIPRNNIVRNKIDKNYLDSIVLIGLKELNIENKIVLLREINNEVKVKNIDNLEGFIINVNKDYIIYLKPNMSRNNFIRVLAHELIHLQDYENNILVVRKDSLFYKDEKYSVNNLPLYEDRSWEINTFKRSPMLSGKIKNKLYN